MEVVKTLSEITSELLHGLLGELLVLLDHLEQVAARAVLKDDPQMVPRLVPVVELEDVPVLQVVENAHLTKSNHTQAKVRLDSKRVRMPTRLEEGLKRVSATDIDLE